LAKGDGYPAIASRPISHNRPLDAGQAMRPLQGGPQANRAEASDRRIDLTIDRYPKLSTGFQSSVRGLHFVGASAAGSFGPLMCFIAGAG
jgi:hypothetical protein